MTSYRTAPLVCLVIASMGGLAAGAEEKLFIYPSNGQSSEQQTQDERECQVWAMEQSDFDPLSVATNEPAAPEKKHSALRGATAGAALGAIVGDSDDAETGAAIGSVMGGRHKRKQARAYEKQQQAAASERQQQTDNYRRSYTVCLEGRGYKVG